MLNFSVCVCVGGGGGGGGGGGSRVLFWVVVFNAFFDFRAKHQIVFLPNKQNLEEYFHRQHFNANIFI